MANLSSNISETIDGRSLIPFRPENDTIIIFINSDDLIPTFGVLFVALAISVGGLLRLVVVRVSNSFPQLSLMIVLGVVVGVISNYSEGVTRYTALAFVDPTILFLVFLPPILFSTTFGIDAHTFGHSILQIFALSIPGFFIQAFIICGLVYPLMGLMDEWTVEAALLFGVICTSTQVQEIIRQLKTEGQGRHVQLLMQGETLVTTAIAIFTTTIIAAFCNEKPNVIDIVLLAVWSILSALCGLLLGLLLKIPFKHAFNDVCTEVTLTLAATYISFYIGHILLDASGAFTVMMLGVVLSSDKTKTSSEVEAFLTFFWDWMFYIATTIVFVISGVVVGTDLHTLSLADLAFVLTAYCLIFIVRGFTFLLLSPLLTRLGYGLPWRNTVIAIWGGIRGAPTLLLGLVYRKDNKMGEKMFTYAVALVLLSMVINQTTLPILLRILGLKDLSKAKEVNITTALKLIGANRDKAISSLRMDRVMADANWPVVEQLTKMKHPYKLSMEENEEDQIYEERITVCTECANWMYAPPTRKEILEMTVETKQRILKAQLVSYWKQYESGTLSRRGIRILTAGIEVSSDKKNPVFELETLRPQWQTSKYWERARNILGTLILWSGKNYHHLPKRKFQRTLFHIVSSAWYEAIIAVFVLLDIVYICYIIYILTPVYRMNDEQREQWFEDRYYQELYLQFGLVIVYFFFALEFGFKVLSFGYENYFQSLANTLEFGITMLVRSFDVLAYANHVFLKTEHIYFTRPNFIEIIYITKFFLLARIIRLYIFWTRLIPRILVNIDLLIDDNLMFGYEIGKAFIVAHAHVCRVISHIIDEDSIQAELKEFLDSERQEVTKDLGHIQKDRPSIAITIKTRHASRHVLNKMNECVHELKDDGLLDDVEFATLIAVIDDMIKNLRTLQMVNPCPPEVILKEIPWLIGDNTSAEFFLEHAQLMSFNYGDAIIIYGDKPKGFYIMVSGLVKSYYIPSHSSLQNKRARGAIPNYDFFVNLKLDVPQEDYVVSGNVIGMLGVLTQRKYDMTVECETSVQAYFVSLNDLEEAFQQSPSLQAQMWKSVGTRIGLCVLQDSSYFQGWVHENILLHLEKSFVPIYDSLNFLEVNELIDDIILIEGIIMDLNTKEQYTAPCLIPRTITKIVFPQSSLFDIAAESVMSKLLIIPSKDIEECDIFGIGIGIDFLLKTQIQSKSTSNSSNSSSHTSFFKQSSGRRRGTITKRKREIYSDFGRAGLRRENLAQTSKSKQLKSESLKEDESKLTYGESSSLSIHSIEKDVKKHKELWNEEEEEEHGKFSWNQVKEEDTVRRGREPNEQGGSQQVTPEENAQGEQENKDKDPHRVGK